MTTLARLLQRDGLITRRPDDTDAGASLVFLTKRATAFAPVAENTLASLASEFEDVLGAMRVRQSPSASTAP